MVRSGMLARGLACGSFGLAAVVGLFAGFTGHASARDRSLDGLGAPPEGRRSTVVVQVGAARPSPTGLPKVHVVETTAKLSDRLKRLPDLRFGGAPPARVEVIQVNDQVRDQRVFGVGGAMTDSSAWLIHDELRPSARANLIDDLFGAGGDHLSFTLVPMGASDFTRTGRPYSYDDTPPGQSDPHLSHFSIAHDRAYIIPVLRQVLATDRRDELFAVPWSPPAWMKANDAANDDMARGTLLPSAYRPLASYFVKFLKAYASAGVPIAAVAPQNEPRAPAPYPSENFPEPTEAQWIADDLAPALHQAGLSTAIYGADVSWNASSYANALATSVAPSMLKGIAWHCYSGIPTVMSAMHASNPALNQLVTECAPRLSPFPIAEILIGSLRNWASSVTLWNLALDRKGGPVQPPNSGCGGCAGIVTIDEQNHSFTLSPAYYELGQVSRFVEPSAWRIDSNSFVSYYYHGGKSYGATRGIDDVAFENPDGTRVVVAYNNSAASTRFAIGWNDHYFTFSLPAGATVTFTWNPRRLTVASRTRRRSRMIALRSALPRAQG